MDYTPTSTELTMSIAEIPSPAVPSELPPPQAPTIPSSQQITFRSSPEEKAAQATLEWSGRAVKFRLRSRGVVLCDGAVDQTTSVGGDLLSPIGDWTEVCRETEEHAQLIEIEQPLARGFTLQRQVVFLPQEEVLFLADAVLCPGDSPPPETPSISHQLHLPLGQGVAFTTAEKTHEGTLGKRRPLALVLPLALPEWRQGSRSGNLAAENGVLQLSLGGRGQRLYAPLLFDLRSRRMAKPFTWRKLTVAENLHAVADEAAVGYRVQLDLLQLLIYRSLEAVGNRTLLGHNLCSEFLLARFSKRGEVESWMEIE